MILRNHGLLVVGRTIPAAFNMLYRMERACEVQVMALSCNTKLVYPPQDVLEATFDKVKPRPNLPNRNGDLAWPALLRKLDRLDPRTGTEMRLRVRSEPRSPDSGWGLISILYRGTTAVASISTRAAFSTRRTTWTSAIAG